MKRSRLLHAALFGMLAATAGCGQAHPTMPSVGAASAPSETAAVASAASTQYEAQQWGWGRRWTSDRWRRRWTGRWRRRWSGRWGRRWTTDRWRRPWW